MELCIVKSSNIDASVYWKQNTYSITIFISLSDVKAKGIWNFSSKGNNSPVLHNHHFGWLLLTQRATTPSAILLTDISTSGLIIPCVIILYRIWGCTKGLGCHLNCHGSLFGQLSSGVQIDVDIPVASWAFVEVATPSHYGSGGIPLTNMAEQLQAWLLLDVFAILYTWLILFVKYHNDFFICWSYIFSHVHVYDLTLFTGLQSYCMC